MFLLLGNMTKDSVLDKVREGSVSGLLVDEATDISVKAQLLMFVKYLDTESGVAKTDFLGVENLLEGKGAEGANADVIFNCLVNQMQKCSLDAEKMTSFVSDGASVMTGRFNGVAAKLKGLNKTPLKLPLHMPQTSISLC